MDHGAISEKNLGVALSYRERLRVPLASFHVHTKNKDAVIGFRSILVSNDFVVEVHSVDRDLVLSGVILAGTSQETMSKEELVDHENARDSVVNPVLEEVETGLQILDITTKRLERTETL